MKDEFVMLVCRECGEERESHRTVQGDGCHVVLARGEKAYVVKVPCPHCEEQEKERERRRKVCDLIRVHTGGEYGTDNVPELIRLIRKLYQSVPNRGLGEGEER